MKFAMHRVVLISVFTNLIMIKDVSMKTIAVVIAIAGLSIAVPAVAAPVTMTFKNASTTTVMNVSKVNTCGVLSPTPAKVDVGKTSFASSTDCGSVGSASTVVYSMGTKTCTFNISTIYTAPNYMYTPPLPGYWTPKAIATGTGGATCAVVSQDASKILTTGAFAAVFSMK
jgi:hypothetical protein